MCVCVCVCESDSSNACDICVYIDGKANNLKRKIVALRKQLKKGLQEENDRKTIQTNHHLQSKPESKQSSKNSNVDTPPRFRQQKPQAVQNIYEEATKTNAEQSQENEVKKKKENNVVDEEPPPTILPTSKSFLLPALDYGKPNKPGSDGMKTKGGGQGGRRKPFNTACFHSKKYMFTLVHVHKNGGSALADNLRRIICKHHNIDEKKMKHLKYPTCAENLWTTGCKHLGEDMWFDFTFSRNPWDRYVSMWSYTLKRKQLQTKDLEKRKSLSDNYCKFEDFVMSDHDNVKYRPFSLLDEDFHKFKETPIILHDKEMGNKVSAFAFSDFVKGKL